MRVSLGYTPSRKTFSRATHASWNTQPSFQIIVLMMIGVWAAANFALGAGSQLEQQLPAFTYILMAIGFYFLYPSFAFAADAKNRSDVRFEFDRSGVSYRFAERESSLPWSALSQATETRDFYVLALPDRLRVALPKDEFGPGAEQRFRLLAATSGVPIRG
jgi:YcxB-like protein